MSSKQSQTAVLLLAHGSPESPEQVPEFLLRVTGGRPLPPHVVEEVRHRYSQVPRLPLTEITLKQGELLEKAISMPVYVGMRNWHPFIADTLSRMQTEGITHAIVICLAPQNSRTSVGLYRSSLQSADCDITFDFLESWHDQRFLIRAFAEKLRSGMARAAEELGNNPPVIFTAHSVPERTIIEGDPYKVQCKQTAELVAMAASLSANQPRFAFQSQGLSGGTWLGPTVEETILALKAQGHRGVFIQPIGFLCDHVEILYDVDIGFREFAEAQGLRLWRAESLNDSPLLISALAEIVQSRAVHAD